jgi:thioredoxin 1
MIPDSLTTEGRMKFIQLILISVFLIVPLSSGYAADIDAMLAKAKEEKKFVMLELGSVGCIPCDQMKSVMSKLSSTYKDKLEVIFVDVRKDTEPARRFRVFVIPTQVFLDRNGKEFHRHVGYYDYESIIPILKKAGI